MTAFLGRLPALRLPRLAVGGAFRVRAVVGLLGLFLLLVLAVAFYGRQSPPPSAVVRAPPLDPKPGDQNSNEYFRQLALEKARRDAEAAAAAGRTYTPDLRVAENHPNVPAPTPVKPQAPAQPQAPAAPANPPAPTTAPTGRSAGRTEKDDQAAKEAQAAYKAAMMALLASWGSKAATRDVAITPEEIAKREQQAQQAAQARQEAAVGSASAATGAASRAGGPKRVLMPALRWVRGRTVVGTDSDTGGPVVVEMKSGPLEGARLSGKARKHEDRLSVTLDQLALPDGRMLRVNAVLMAPDSKETAVASGVEHRYIPRIVLPTLAAGVQGLGQALALSGSSVFAGAYGAAQSYSRFNPGQIAGIAAGTAAGQFGQIIQQQTPRQSKVNLDAEVDVGVMFLAPVEDAE